MKRKRYKPGRCRGLSRVTGRAYYGDNEPFAVEWLRRLIARGLIADGVVDGRDVRDVHANDLAGASQAHFFAGIGGWSYALRLAGWPETRVVWTGSCPCQPFSQAGKGKGIEDRRHLWPVWRDIIAERLPPTIFGEQVASSAGREWLAGVRADLEALGYAVGAADLCAAGVGAPHIRQRLWWVADADSRKFRDRRIQPGWEYGQQPQNGSAPRGLGESNSAGRDARKQACKTVGHGSPTVAAGDVGGKRYCSYCDGWYPESSWRWSDGTCPDCGLADAEMPERRSATSQEDAGRRVTKAGGSDGPYGLGDARSQGSGRDAGAIPGAKAPGGGEGGEARREPHEPVAPGFWSAFDLVACADGKQRRVEPGVRPLAHGVPRRVGLLRGYGNSIVPQVAATFIRAFMEAQCAGK